MKSRMVCLRCREAAKADTLLSGSDRVEALGWLLLALPGLAYCAWRHLDRAKACPFCGSPDLMRETRALSSHDRNFAPRPVGSLYFSERGELAWPSALGTPRQRLLHGGVLAALVAVLGVASALGALGLVEPEPALLLGHGASIAGAVWIGFQLHRLATLRTTVRGCVARDQTGREIRIELVRGPA